MAKAPVLGNDPFLRGAAQHDEPVSSQEAAPPAPEAPAAPAPAEPPAPKAAARPKAKAKPRARAKPEKAPKAAAKKKAPQPEPLPEPEPEPVPEPQVVLGPPPSEPAPAWEEPVPVAPPPEAPAGWAQRAKQAASGMAEQAVQSVLASPLAQRTLESVMASPVTHKVADAASRAVSAARPALDTALRFLPPAAQATRAAVASVVSGGAARTLVTAATEAGAALCTAARRSEPASGEVDDFGEDPTLLSRAEPLFDFLYDRYFRLEALQASRVPDGASVLVCNHSGVLPLDGPMIRTVLRRECGRFDGRWLLEDSLFHAPMVGTLLNRLGGVRACPENAERLLAKKGPVAVFPEGQLGVSKPVSQRYRLQRFGRGGFVKLALRTGSPIVPVAIVGAEEASPLLAKIPLGRSVGLSYLPVTPTFPLLGPLGLLPFPTKWTVSFLEPVALGKHGPEDAADEALVAKLTAEVRDAIQAELERLVARRHSLISG